MADPTEPVPPKRVVRPVNSITSINVTLPSSPDKMLCERCGAEMYRMHAVWRCPSCGFKTDCCGW